MSAHTPGEWAAEEAACNSIDIRAGGRVIAIVLSDDDMGDMLEPADEANGQLIAAAPDLLIALLAIVQLDDNADFGNLADTDGGGPGECCPYGSEALKSALAAARAAIAKATQSPNRAGE
jgi:hypothetical protein